MSSVSVLDASAVLAFLQREKGHERVEAALDAGPSWLSAVNLCEILSKLCERAMLLEDARIAVGNLGLAVMDFDAELAARAAFLRLRTKPIGASLGDRACLALAQQAADAGQTPTVYTAERAWTDVKWPFKVALIR